MTWGPSWYELQGGPQDEPLIYDPGPSWYDEPAAEVARSQPCHDCRGSGANAEAPGDCPTCGGWGTISR
jgi:hypothetical protein